MERLKGRNLYQGKDGCAVLSQLGPTRTTSTALPRPAAPVVWARGPREVLNWSQKGCKEQGMDVPACRSAAVGPVGWLAVGQQSFCKCSFCILPLWRSAYFSIGCCMWLSALDC